MKLAKALILFALILTAATPARAQFGNVTVYDVFVVDPLIGMGGYNELTVVNDGATSIYAVVIGQDTSQVIYTSPALAGLWSPRRDNRTAWDQGSIFTDYGGYAPPRTQDLDWDVYVGVGFSQVLAWQVPDIANKIPAGGMLVGLRYLPGEGARAFRAAGEGLPFVAFDETGSAVASGITVPNLPVPTVASNFSRIKSLFR